MINWHAYEKNGEKILDFCISDGKFIYEWNLYRYMKQKYKKDNYVVLCAFTYRDSLLTNDDLKPFFNRIVENREDYIKKLGEVKIPSISVE